MRYIEVQGDLFTVDNKYYLVHCISADAKMGAGIAVEFKKRFILKNAQEKARRGELSVGECFKEERVLNLITKEKYWHKPTPETFKTSLQEMKRVILEEGITKIAMPQIGAGLDKLKWTDNRKIIKELFEDVEIDIAVYIKK